MQRRLIRLALSAVLALPAGGVCLAASAQPKSTAASPSQAVPRNDAAAKRVDINSASRVELKTLPGIGDAEAARIIAARPYPSKAKLVEAKVLPASTYWALEELIVAVQAPPLKTRPDGQASTKP